MFSVCRKCIDKKKGWKELKGRVLPFIRPFCINIVYIIFMDGYLHMGQVKRQFTHGKWDFFL